MESPAPIDDDSAGLATSHTEARGRPLERTDPKAVAAMRLDLHWQSAAARHTETLIAPKLNLWRDIFPSELEPEVIGQPVGHRASHTFAPGDLVPSLQETRILRLRQAQFDRRFTGRGYVQPRAGRYYPKGIIEGVDGIYRADRQPFRVGEATLDSLVADLNHPLADRSLRLDCTVEAIWAQGDEHGGRCNEVADLITAGGPGMQSRWRGIPTDFWSDAPFERPDPRPDAEFYAGPRLVDHLDKTAIAQVSALYGRLIPPGARVLDLMASWHSHLPPGAASTVAGLGMNLEELQANPVLDQRLVQDLNLEPILAFPDGAFDAVVCTVSVEYLTQPFAVFREVARVLVPGGRFLVSFSNRWFPPKAIRLWEAIHEFERPGLVLEYFLESGLFGNLESWSLRGLLRPADDKYANRLPYADPVYAVWGERTQP
jgi:hypothetical protein